MDWARILAYINGTVDQKLLLRKEYLVAENRILKPRKSSWTVWSVRLWWAGLAHDDAE